MDNPQALFYAVLSNKLSAFVQKSFNFLSPNDKYLHNWHVDAMCDYLDAVELGHIKKLIINIPPRFMKSITVSQAWTAYLLGRNPKLSIIVSSFSKKLSDNLSSQTRSLMLSDWYQATFKNLKLKHDFNRTDWFKTTEGGQRYSTSVGGTITGLGADILILDDPINPNDAMSDTVRETTNEWVRSSFMTRANNPKDVRVVCVMQRLHENDVTGFLQSCGDFETLKLPVLFEQKTIIQTPKKQYALDRNSFLHKERIAEKEIDSLKKNGGSFFFAGQYMQNPAPSDGGIIKKSWINPIIQKKNTFEKIYHSWDTASKANAGSDYSALTVWGVSNNHFYLIDAFKKQMEYPELRENVIKYAFKYNPEIILLEDKSSGIALAQDLKYNSRLPIVTQTPFKDKVTRLSNVTPMFEGGRVLIDLEKEWSSEYVHELITFPNATHDDYADSTSQFLNYVQFRMVDASLIKIKRKQSVLVSDF